MRISDWSSDVCSSDLRAVDVIALATQQRDTLLAFLDRDQALQLAAVADVVKVDHLTDVGEAEAGALGAQYPGEPCPVTLRSEEHTSELQSLMRISYAVFCLKKKISTNKTK